MKALSIRQPWAWLIVEGYKEVENRDWPTRFRGRFLIHAGKAFDQAGYVFVRQQFPTILLPAREEFDRGGIVGEATLLDCVTESPSPWFFGRFGFVLAEAKALPFRPMPGKLSFFNFPAAEISDDQ